MALRWATLSPLSCARNRSEIDRLAASSAALLMRRRVDRRWTAVSMPRLALSLLTGLAGDHFFAAQDNPSGLRDDRLANLSLFGSLHALGVF